MLTKRFIAKKRKIKSKILIRISNKVHQPKWTKTKEEKKKLQCHWLTVFVFYFSPNPEQSCFPKTYQFRNSEVLLCCTCEKALQNLTCVRKFEQCFLRTNHSLKKATGKTWVKYLVAPMFEEGLYSFQVANWSFWSFWSLDLRSISTFVKILRPPFFGKPQTCLFMEASPQRFSM